jgi:molybdopterin synthase sulfur carrier subunit
MAVNVLIPTPLRRYTGEKDTVSVEAGNISDLVLKLESDFPGLVGTLRDDQGELRRFVNLYLNEEDVRFMQGKETPIKDGDSVSIVPAIAGG